VDYHSVLTVLNHDLKLQKKSFCTSCLKEISRSDFSDDNIERQRYDKETKNRDNLNKTFNRRREDFDTLKEYNDYLELVQDISYDLLYGKDEEQKIANKKIMQYQKDHKEWIQKNFNLEV